MLMATIAVGCKEAPKSQPEAKLIDKYAEYTLTTDISHLSENEIQMLPLLFQAADVMEELFWQENYGDKAELMSRISDPDVQRFACITYGPWDGLDGNKPFVEGFGEKPAGAQFYPQDMTEEEWNAFDDPDKNSQYTMIVRDEDGNLKCVWYHD